MHTALSYGAEDLPAAISVPIPVSASYRQLTDDQLTAVGADWDRLSQSQKRALLDEVKLRMARQRGRDSVIQIRAVRRYGYITKPDGSRIRVEQTQLVRVTPKGGAKSRYGVGFERRAEPKAPVANQVQTPPVYRVSDPN